MADEILDFLKEKFNRIDARFDQLLDALTKLTERVDDLDNRVDALAVQIARSMLAMQAELVAFTKEIRRRLETLP